MQTKASPKIIQNTISMNNTQGILLVENSWAIIVGNSISANCKANIALGGLDSQNTVISSNTIENGQAEGIFIIRSGRTMIRNNNVSGN